MKTLKLLILLMTIVVFDTKAQTLTADQQGSKDGIAVGVHVLQVDVYGNCPPRAVFNPLEFGRSVNPVLMPDGSYQNFSSVSLNESTTISQIKYDQFVAGYAYEHGIVDFYLNEAFDIMQQSGGSYTDAYWSGWMGGFQEAIQNIQPVNNPQGGEPGMPGH